MSRIKISRKELYFWRRYFYTGHQVFRNSHFFNKATSYKEVLIQPLFQESSFFRAANFSKELLYHSSYFCKTYSFRSGAFSQLHFLSTAILFKSFSLTPVTQDDSVRIISCVSIIAQSPIIGRVYIVSWLGSIDKSDSGHIIFQIVTWYQIGHVIKESCGFKDGSLSASHNKSVPYLIWRSWVCLLQVEI